MNVIGLYTQLLLLVVLPVVVGMVCSRGKHARKVASKLFALSLYLFQTLILLLAVWTADLAGGSWILPVITFAGWSASLGVAYAGSRWLRHPKKQRGSFLFTICISNHGYSLLGIVALMVFGDPGLAQASYAQFFIMPFVILVCFPIARAHGEGHERKGLVRFVKDNLLDKRNVPLVAMMGGLALNLLGLERPQAFTSLLSYAVYIGTVSSGIAIGLLFDPSTVLKYPRENVFSLVYRSTLYPLFFLGAARLFGLGHIDTFVLVLYGIVPAAIFSNLIADMFDLDRGLANSVYIVSTSIFLVAVLPIYLYAVSLAG